MGVESFELRLATPVGTVGLQWNVSGVLSGIRWIDTGLSVSDSLSAPLPPIPPKICAFMGQLNDYFESGEPLGEIPWSLIDTQGWTPFQTKVYSAITAIPHGETRSYGWVATRIQAPFAGRAVGQALRRNPLMILVPCHRVVPTTGGLGGFKGQDDPNQPELRVKKRLLELEESYLNPMFSFLPSVSQGGVVQLFPGAGNIA